MKQLTVFLILALATMAGIPAASAGDAGALFMQTPILRQSLNVAIFGEYESDQIVRVRRGVSNSDLRALMNEASLTIFKSPTAQRVFCPYASTTKDALYNFGVPDEAAHEIVRICRREPHPRLAGYRDPNLPLPANRDVYFADTREPARVESWSDSTGLVFIFKTGTITKTQLLRDLLHEYFISYDALFDAASLDDVSKAASVEIRADGDQKAKQEAFYALHSPLVHGTFQMSRALNFENIVLGELTGAPRAPTANCWSLMRSLAKEIQGAQDLYSEEYTLLLPNSDPQRQAVMSGGLEKITEMERLDAQAHFQPSLCDVLSHPHIGLGNIGMMHGPRPRLGSGSERTTGVLSGLANAPGLVKPKTEDPDLKVLESQFPLSFPSTLPGLPGGLMPTNSSGKILDVKPVRPAVDPMEGMSAFQK